jgi:hypothetical protein
MFELYYRSPEDKRIEANIIAEFITHYGSLDPLQTAVNVAIAAGARGKK